MFTIDHLTEAVRLARHRPGVHPSDIARAVSAEQDWSGWVYVWSTVYPGLRCIVSNEFASILERYTGTLKLCIDGSLCDITARDLEFRKEPITHEFSWVFSLPHEAPPSGMPAFPWQASKQLISLPVWGADHDRLMNAFVSLISEIKKLDVTQTSANGKLFVQAHRQAIAKMLENAQLLENAMCGLTVPETPPASPRSETVNDGDYVPDTPPNSAARRPGKRPAPDTPQKHPHKRSRNKHHLVGQLRVQVRVPSGDTPPLGQ